MTCGHLFRTNRGQTPITIEYFVNGQLQPTPGTVIDYQCDDVDIALISFKSTANVAKATMRPSTEPLREGEIVASYGCDHGAEPTRRDSRITKLNRYLGAPNVEASGAPVQGRSGGGLFDERGRLIGVCYAADNDLNEGLYGAPQVIYQQVDKFGLAYLHNRPATPVPGSFASSQPLQREPIELVQMEAPSANSSLNLETSMNSEVGVASMSNTMEASDFDVRAPLANSVSLEAERGIAPKYNDGFPDSKSRLAISNAATTTPISIPAGSVSSLTVIVRTSDGQQKILDIPDAPSSLVQALQLQAMPRDGQPTAIASRR